MGWTVDGALDHEGWVTNVLDDGRGTGTTTAGGVVLLTVTEMDRRAGYEIRTFAGGAEEVVVPWERVTAWRVGCECGWSGTSRPAYTTDQERGWRDCPEELEDGVFRLEWRAHVAPFTALEDLERLVDERRRLDDRIAELASSARQHGASWTEIGRAISMSKQGAQQRYGG